MDTKICSKCKLPKPIHISKSGKWVYSKCKDCHEQYAKEKYITNKQKRDEQSKNWRLNNPDKAKEIKAKAYRKDLEKSRSISRQRAFSDSLWLRELKETTPCADCGLKFHYCIMDFDHISGDKTNTISALRGNKALCLEEIKKCQLVCSNCHRMRTYNRKQYRPLTTLNRPKQ